MDSRHVLSTVLLFGVVSLLGDIIYEGSRGLVSTYLTSLGASVLVVTLVGRAGELLSHVLRLVGGRLADVHRAYWTFIFLGYGLLVTIPLLGIAGAWWIAALLVLAERAGKALRSPSRDALLTMVGEKIGKGKTFGVHELLDQVGAVLGPLLVALLMLYTGNNYTRTFGFLVIPFLALVLFLYLTYRRCHLVVEKIPEKSREKPGREFYLYTLAVALSTVGLLPYELVLLRASKVVSVWTVPLLYMLIQLVDGPVALFSGHAYDKYGIRVLVVSFALSVLPPLFVLSGAGLLELVVAAMFLGSVLGMHESIYRAAVSEFAPPASLATAYGVFHTVYGTSLFLGGIVYGLFVTYAVSRVAVVIYAVLTQLLATLILVRKLSLS